MRLLCLFFAAGLFAQQNPPGMQCHERTLVLFATGPNTAKQKDFRAAHMEYMRQHMRTGEIIAAGPFGSGDGAAIIFTSSEWADVEKLLQSEPFTSAGVIKVTEHKTWSACQLIGAQVIPTAP